MAHYNQESVILSVTWLVSVSKQISVELVAAGSSRFQVSTTFLAGDIAFLMSLLCCKSNSTFIIVARKQFCEDD